MTAANLAGGGFAVPVTEADVEMAGVNPLRFAEVRRRVAAVKAFLHIPAPTDDDRAQHAAYLGLSVNQFQALVRAWREHGRAVAISGAGAAKGAPRPSGPRNLPAASKAAAAEIIATLEPETPLVEAVRLIKERCGSLRVPTPSRSTIWNMLMAHRRMHSSAGQEGVVVCRCWVKMPVATDREVQFMEIALAVDMATGIILAAAAADDQNAASAIAAGIRSWRSSRAVLIDAEFAGAVGSRTNAELIPVKSTAARTATAKVLGRGFGTLDLIYQRSRAISPAALLRSKKDAALQPEDARRVIEDQLAAHNATRGAEPPLLSWKNSHVSEHFEKAR